MDIFKEKKVNSDKKLSQLKRNLSSIPEIEPFQDLAIFATGSYARGEASTFSDIDLFFVNRLTTKSIPDINIRTLRLFAKIVEIADEMEFPKFSNDGEFLKIIESPQILEHLGNSADDYMNHFTARLLMILESKPVFGLKSYNNILREVLGRYFEDYPDHPEDFRPTFLINDIIRFWKTLCLNYENKRNQPIEDEQKRIAQKIKNLKLKFSRMLTCFGSVCYIASENGTIGPEQLIKMTQLSPIERLRHSVRTFDLCEEMGRAEKQYGWFLKLTNVSEEDLRKHFSEKGNRIEAFKNADAFGNAIFEITKKISSETGYLRYLVV